MKNQNRLDIGTELVKAFMTNECINQVLLEILDPDVWNRYPPCSKRRNIATTFAHIHNVRRMRIVMSLKEAAPPPKLSRATITLEQAKESLAITAKLVVDLIQSSLKQGGRVKIFPPGIIAFVCAGINHEAHHRGQICHWARELGSPISQENQLILWEWNKLWKTI